MESIVTMESSNGRYSEVARDVIGRMKLRGVVICGEGPKLRAVCNTISKAKLLGKEGTLIDIHLSGNF